MLFNYFYMNHIRICIIIIYVTPTPQKKTKIIYVTHEKEIQNYESVIPSNRNCRKTFFGFSIVGFYG